MRTQTFRTALVGILCFNACATLLGTLPSHSQEDSSNVAGPTTKVVNDPKFHARLLEIAAEYPQYGKVDDIMRWVPTLCMFQPPPKAEMSRSKDAHTHGQKLFYLFAKVRHAYVRNEAVLGQVIVKEAWHPPSPDAIKAAAEDIKSRDGTPARPILMFEPEILGPKSGLYIMYNTESKTAETDDGWVYGTVTEDGKTVTSAGRVKSCMECHASAKHGRLFGLENAKSVRLQKWGPMHDP